MHVVPGAQPVAMVLVWGTLRRRTGEARPRPRGTGGSRGRSRSRGCCRRRTMRRRRRTRRRRRGRLRRTSSRWRSLPARVVSIRHRLQVGVEKRAAPAGQVGHVEGARGFARPGLGLEDDSVGGRHVGWFLGRWGSGSGGYARDRDIVQPHGVGLGPVTQVVPGAQVVAMVLVWRHFGDGPAKVGQGLEVQAVAGVVHAVGDAVVGVPVGDGGALGDGGGVARAAHRPAGGPCRRV